jgi:pyruvate/2-oxoglutarate dehydrogenase complex dihydrolipoamide acyltransferase (E2) component
MSTDIVVADDLWDGEQTCVLSRWLYRTGDHVEAGALIAELMVEKISFDVLAPASGALRTLVAEEQTVTRGMALGTVG